MQYCIRVLFALFLFVLLSSCRTSPQTKPEQTSESRQESVAKSHIIATGAHSIVMGWNAFGNTDSYIQQSSISPALNVVSPDWFKLSANPLVLSKVDPRYVEWAHNSGKQVWPLFGNRFNTELTNSVISDALKRQQVIKLLRDNLVSNKIDGINVDF